MIKYQMNRSTGEDIISHWKLCNTVFLSSLSQQKNIETYALKISSNATRFEAWDDKLIGLVACYLNNENGIGFITNVSVAEAHEGKGIATHLIEQCIAHSKEIGFKMINLEVEEKNEKAIKLYETLGFFLLSQQEDGKKIMQNKWI